MPRSLAGRRGTGECGDGAWRGRGFGRLRRHLNALWRGQGTKLIRDRWRDDIWTMKYLSGFKWEMLGEQVGECAECPGHGTAGTTNRIHAECLCASGIISLEMSPLELHR
jgi:hypothetical protein